MFTSLEYSRFFKSWKIYLLVFVAVVAAFQLAVMQLNPFMMSLALVPVYYFVAKILVDRYTKRYYSTLRILTEIFCLAFVWRLAEVFIFAQILQTLNGVPFLSEHDDSKYHFASQDIYTFWKEYGIQWIAGSKIRYIGTSNAYAGYPYYSAFMMMLFGPNVFSVRIANAFFSALTVLVVFGLLANYLDRSKAIFTTVLFAFAPIFTIFAAINFKDTLLLFAYLLTLMCIINFMYRRFMLFSLLAVVGTCSFMIFCRPATVLIIALGCAMFFAMQGLQRRGSFIAAVAVVLLPLITITMWDFFDSIGVAIGFDEFVELNLNASERTISESKAGVAQYSWAKLLGAPVFALASPFLPPMNIANFGELKTIAANYTLHGMLPYFALLPFMISGCLHAFKNRRVDVVPFFLLLQCFIYKFSQASSLVACLNARQSLPAIAVLYLMLPVGIERYGERSDMFPKIVIGASLFITILFNVYRLYF